MNEKALRPPVASGYIERISICETMVTQAGARLANKKRHYHVDFAARYARTHFPTLNAYSSIWRIESLIEDTRMLDELRELAEAKDIRFGNRMRTYEIVDYFPVGFVTCLEWHARSRIVDLLTFAPACIDAKDVRTIDKDALSQMAAANVTLPHIVGATTRISGIQDYISIATVADPHPDCRAVPHCLA
jgi:hypothetical protein